MSAARGPWGLVENVLVGGSLPRILKEMMFVAISKERGCRYCEAAPRRSAGPHRDPAIRRLRRRGGGARLHRCAPSHCRVNGKRHTVDVEPSTPLLYVLRNDLDLPARASAAGLASAARAPC